jgi:hypothetical protein
MQYRRFGLLTALTVLFALSHIGTGSIGTVRAQSPLPTRYDPAACQPAAEGNPLTRECLEMMVAFPRPVVTNVPQDTFTLSNYSFWKIGPGATNLYDAPGGNLIGQHPAGFNFVNVVSRQDGWLQIEGGQWIAEADASYDEPSYFTGVTLQPDSLDHPFAWVLDMSNIYVSAYPGGPASTETGRFLQRYERVNIFAVARDAEGMRWYMIGPNQWVKQTFVAKVQKVERPEGVTGRWVSVDLYEQILIAYEDDTPVFATIVSTGKPPNDTNEGLFTVWASLQSDRMAGATGAPNAYALQRVPWVMYFDDGISLHGTYWHDIFGYRTSRGCVNLTISDAKWIFDFFTGSQPNANGEIVNHVFVYSSGEYGSGVIRE